MVWFGCFWAIVTLHTFFFLGGHFWISTQPLCFDGQKLLKWDWISGADSGFVFFLQDGNSHLGFWAARVFQRTRGTENPNTVPIRRKVIIKRFSAFDEFGLSVDVGKLSEVWSVFVSLLTFIKNHLTEPQDFGAVFHWQIPLNDHQFLPANCSFWKSLYQ